MPFFLAAVLFYILTSAQGSNRSTSSPALVIFCFLDSGLPNRGEVVSHCGFDLPFPHDC
jgi:hypothetical protein